MGRVVSAMVMAVVMAGAANAGERTAYPAIASGDLAGAERTLVAERRIFPERPELMLNLAAVYRQTGRTAAAVALYQDVLTAPAIALDMPSGAVRSSHAVAQAALRSMTPATIAAR